MRIILRTETLVVEERETQLTQELCDEFNKHIKCMYDQEIEPITISDVVLFENSKPSKLDQRLNVKGYHDTDYRVPLSSFWLEWIEEELWDIEANEIERECEDQETYLAL